MWPLGTQIAILLLFFKVSSLVEAVVEGDPTPKGVSQNTTRVLPSSIWLKNVTNPRAAGCWYRPWICNYGQRFPPVIKKLCCRNRCVDVRSDVNNCGLCGIRCPFTSQCCNGRCINTNVNPFHCGKCWHRCPFRSLCFYGMCGYAQPLPPFPFPLPPKHPRPPFPFPLPPKHPRPPFPFPPKTPRGNPPFPPKPHPPTMR